MIPQVKPMPATRLAKVHSAVIRVARMRNGSSGSVTRRSHTTNRAMATTNAVSRPSVRGEVQGESVPVWLRARSRQVTPPPSRSAPSTSMRCFTMSAWAGW